MARAPRLAEQVEVAYVITVHDTTPAEHLLERYREQLAPSSVVQLCREVPHDARVADLPLLGGGGRAAAVECWAADVNWFLGALNDLSRDFASHLVVRMTWPIATEVEMALLLATLQYPELRVAVRLSAETAEAAFRYCNRLGLSWFALPGAMEPNAAWGETLRRLCRAWCHDPASRAVVEPIASGFKLGLEQRLSTSQTLWQCRLVGARANDDRVASWSPTLHAFATGAPSEFPPLPIADFAIVDRIWIADVLEVCRRIDVDRLAELVAVPRAKQPLEVADDL
jgi:hypothetical protein